jgi:Protein of unknown function (DUF2523)
MGALGTWLVALGIPLAKKVLTALGFGLISYAALTAALNSAMDSAKAAWSGAGGDVLALLQIGGVPTVMSITCGAIVARLALVSLKKLDILR